MTEAAMTEPRTEAGRQMLRSMALTYADPPTLDDWAVAILAIEAEAAAGPRDEGLLGAYREAAAWITDVQLRFGLGPEASPQDIWLACQAEEPRDDGLRDALLSLHRTDMPDGPCWCSVAPNKTVGPRHEAKCRAARAALAKASE